MEVYDKLPVSGTTPEHTRLPQSNRLIAPFMVLSRSKSKIGFCAQMPWGKVREYNLWHR